MVTTVLKMVLGDSENPQFEDGTLMRLLFLLWSSQHFEDLEKGQKQRRVLQTSEFFVVLETSVP
jgi:hypothetical protein